MRYAASPASINIALNSAQFVKKSLNILSRFSDFHIGHVLIAILTTRPTAVVAATNFQAEVANS